MFTEWILEALYFYYLCISHATINVVSWKCVDILYSILKRQELIYVSVLLRNIKFPVILWTVSCKDVRKSNQALSEQMLPSRGWHSCFLFGTYGFKPLSLETGYRESDISSASPVLWQEITYALNYPTLDHWRFPPPTSYTIHYLLIIYIILYSMKLYFCLFRLWRQMDGTEVYLHFFLSSALDLGQYLSSHTGNLLLGEKPTVFI